MISHVHRMGFQLYQELRLCCGKHILGLNHRRRQSRLSPIEWSLILCCPRYSKHREAETCKRLRQANGFEETQIAALGLDDWFFPSCQSSWVMVEI